MKSKALFSSILLALSASAVLAQQEPVYVSVTLQKF